MNGQDNNIRQPNPIRRFSFYIPFTWYFFLFAVGFLLGFRWTKTFPRLPDTAYADIFPLLQDIAGWFLFSVVVISLLSVFLPFLYFVWQIRQRNVQFRVETKMDGQAKSSAKQKQAVFIHLHPVFKPLLGYVKLRLQYDEQHFSDKFSVVEQRQQKLISNIIEGTYHWELPVIKEYNIHNAIIYFEDFFQFFSFAFPLATASRFYTQPLDTETKNVRTFPRKTENVNTRIEEIKKVEGEYINYKHFEGNDDVRRIVWKIYAKNKELVVRIPEVLDPYASHVFLYASFYSSFGLDLGEVIDLPFLNYYKTCLWNVYRQLVQQGFDVRYLPDQPVASSAITDAQQAVKYSISISHWQTDKDLKSYLNVRDAAIIVVSSLSDADQVAQLAEQSGSDISFVFVKLTDSLGNAQISDWLQWLFVKNEPDAVYEYKRRWKFSLLRSKLVDNEQKLAAVLAQFSHAGSLET